MNLSAEDVKALVQLGVRLVEALEAQVRASEIRNRIEAGKLQLEQVRDARSVVMERRVLENSTRMTDAVTRSVPPPESWKEGG